jgi:hypothetical protein
MYINNDQNGDMRDVWVNTGDSTTTTVTQGYIFNKGINANQPTSCINCNIDQVYGPYDISNISNPVISNIIGKQISENGEWHLNVHISYSFNNSSYINSPGSNWFWEAGHSRSQYSYRSDLTVNNSANNSQLYIKVRSLCERHYVNIAFNIQTWVDTSYTTSQSNWETSESVWICTQSSPTIWSRVPLGAVPDGTANTANVNTVLYDSRGTSSFTVPSNVSQLYIVGVGGGGPGIGWHLGSGSYSQRALPGGAGGGINISVPVSAGDVISSTVGQGGGPGYYNGGTGAAGTDTKIKKNGSVIATANKGGSNYANGSGSIASGYEGAVITAADGTGGQLASNDGGVPGGCYADVQTANGGSHYSARAYWSHECCGGTYNIDDYQTASIPGPVSNLYGGLGQYDGWITIQYSID